jgi:hypothetical protein
VSKNGIFAPFIYQKRTFYQDRLGTNIGKTQKRDRFSSGDIDCEKLISVAFSDKLIGDFPPQDVEALRQRCGKTDSSWPARLPR